MAVDDKGSPLAIGKEMGVDPTHGHTPGVNPDASDKRSFEDAAAAAAAEPALRRPEDIMSMDNLPTDPKEIEKLLGVEFGDRSTESAAQMTAARMSEAVAEGTVTPFVAGVETAAPAAAAAPDAAALAAAAAAAAAAPAEGEGPIAARDGTKTIPYAVLKSTRQRAAALEQENIDLRARLAAGIPAAAAPVEGDGTVEDEGEETPAAMQPFTDAEVADLKSKYPEDLIDVLVASRNAAVDASNRLAVFETAIQNEHNADLRTTAQTVQDMIDTDPVLSAWQNDDDTTMWESAVALDDTLKNLPLWAKRTPAERFSEVKRVLGAPASAAAAAPATTTPPAKTPSLAEVAAARLAAAAAKQASPQAFTHSDLPGGSPPTQSEHELVSNMTNMDLEKSMEKMTPTQLNAFLSRMA